MEVRTRKTGAWQRCALRKVAESNDTTRIISAWYRGRWDTVPGSWHMVPGSFNLVCVIKGTWYRVRARGFTSSAEADKAKEKLAKLGYKGMVVKN